ISEGIEPIVRPASNADCDLRAATAIESSTSPQPTVAHLAIFKARTSLNSLARDRRKSTTVVDASEFSAALMLAIAAARIAAMISPAIPGGILFHTNSGYTRSNFAGGVRC